MKPAHPHLKWKIEETHPKMVETLDEAFRQVMDPEMGLNIMELGLIRDVRIDDDENSAHITMIMTTPFCPYAPMIMEKARSKAASVLDRATTIEMGREYWDPTFMEEGTGADWGLF
ncbi:MAG: iron-sulfur cluster assembly protein [Chloroflexota bacterium]|nr:iron-sulfur cluster assembly protein [Chloroflexota bacterium]